MKPVRTPFIMLPVWVYEDAAMTPTILHIYLKLAGSAFKRKSRSSIAELERQTGYKKTSIYASLATLRRMGALVDRPDGTVFLPVDPPGGVSATPEFSATAESRSAQTENDSAVAERAFFSREVSREPLVEQVFAVWAESTGKTRAKLDEKRRRVIERALSDYPLEEVVAAVGGWRYSPHHAGQNDRREVYNEITLLLRDAAHIERFRDLAYSGRPPVGDEEGHTDVADVELERFLQRKGERGH